MCLCGLLLKLSPREIWTLELMGEWRLATADARPTAAPATTSSTTSGAARRAGGRGGGKIIYYGTIKRQKIMMLCTHTHAVYA